MDTRVALALRDLVSRFGSGLWQQPDRLRNLLNDYCPDSKREIFVVVSAAVERIPEQVANGQIDTGEGALVRGRLVSQLIALGFTAELAGWAIGAWEFGLGTVQEPPLDATRISAQGPVGVMPPGRVSTRNMRPPRVSVPPTKNPIIPAALRRAGRPRHMWRTLVAVLVIVGVGGMIATAALAYLSGAIDTRGSQLLAADVGQLPIASAPRQASPTSSPTPGSSAAQVVVSPPPSPKPSAPPGSTPAAGASPLSASPSSPNAGPPASASRGVSSAATATLAPVPKLSEITPVSIAQAQTISVRGSGFGTLNPFNGTSKFFKFADETRGWNAGFTNNSITVSVTKWSDNEIVLNGFDGAFPDYRLGNGDRIVVSVWNPQSGLGPTTLSTTVGSGLPRPSIASVTPMAATANQTVTIQGSGFGTQQPYVGGSQFLSIKDETRSWAAACADCSVTVGVQKWSDSELIIGNFGGTYSQYKFGSNDRVTLSVWNAQTGAGPGTYSLTIGDGLPKPTITSIGRLSTAQDQLISIQGTGLGSLPVFSGVSEYIRILDETQTWSAGYTGNSVTINVAKWTDSEIVVNGFGGTFGQYRLAAGDKITVNVWNPQSGLGPAVFSTTVG